MQVVEAVSPERPLVVRDHVVAVEVRLAVFQGGHEQDGAVWGKRHVQNLIDFEQFPHLHLVGAHVHQPQLRCSAEFRGKGQGLALGVPRQPGVQIVVEPGQTVTQHRPPRHLARFHVQGSHAELAAFVGGEGELGAVRRWDKLGVLEPSTEWHGDVRSCGTSRLPQCLGRVEIGHPRVVVFGGMTQMVGADFCSQVGQVKARGQSEPTFDAPGDACHVEHVGHGGQAVDVGHVRPNGLTQHGRLLSRTLIHAPKRTHLTSVENQGLTFSIESTRSEPRGTLRHPLWDENEVAASEALAPLTVVHGLVEQDAGQSLADVALQLQPVARAVEEHFAPDQPSGSTDVGLFILRGHDADVALPEFLLGLEHEDLNRPLHRSPKHGAQVFGFLLENAGQLAGDLVSLTVVVHLEHALLEVLPFEGAMLHAVLAKLHVQPVRELGTQ